MELETVDNGDGTYHLNVWNGSDLISDSHCANLLDVAHAKVLARKTCAPSWQETFTHNPGQEIGKS